MSAFAGFGAPAAAAPAPGGFGVPAPTPAPAAGGFNFGGPSATPGTQPAQSNASAPGGFGGGGGTNTAAAAAAAAAPPTLNIPAYDTLFPGRSVWNRVGALLTTAAGAGVQEDSNEEATLLAGQELMKMIKDNKDTLLKPQSKSVLQPVVADQALRQRLSQHPKVSLTVFAPHDGSETQQEAYLAPNMLQDVCNLADDLQISEQDAICLYHAASSSKSPFRSALVNDCLGANTKRESTVAWTAREIYVAQRPMLLSTSLQLLQHRSSEGANSAVCVATDFLLESGWIANIIALVRDYSRCIDDMLADAANTTAGGAKRHFWRYTTALQSCYEERQTAVECLFFAAYNVQLDGEEVGALIDLVRELSDRNPILDPYTNVTNPYEVQDALPADALPWQQQQQQHILKDPLVWQQELVKAAWASGQPQLLRCYSTVVMAVVSALGNCAVLVDRVTHEANVFGVGNALLPPGAMSFQGLSAIHNRLHKGVEVDWKRPDVLGLLMASYAVLLRSSPSTLSSPRASASSDGSFDVRKTWRYCMEAPAKLKSFSFARLSLVPALQKPNRFGRNDDACIMGSPGTCIVSEFLLSVLAEFGSSYLSVLSASGDRPISRAKWKQDAEEDLLLQQSHQEQQQSFRGQFGTNAAGAMNEVPRAVDLLRRPDCMDDVIAFATSVCSLGPDYASKFWSFAAVKIEEGAREIADFTVSSALRDLESQQREDGTLQPSYLSFLAALALAKNPRGGKDGATVIHEMFSRGDNSHADWSSIIDVVRYYVRELDPQGFGTSRGSSASSSGFPSSSGSSTAYYYFDQGTGGEAATQGSKDRTSGDTSSRSKPSQLGDENTFILLSHLALVSNVAANSAKARCAIVSMHLPILSSDGTETIGQDSTLMVLFTLGVMPLSPSVRGMVFGTLAKLLSTDGSNDLEASEMRKLAVTGWELLEACQIVPIHMLEQYQSAQDHNAQPAGTGMAFPPSSTSMAVEKSSRIWVPVDPRYAIVYELEYIESSLGVYPSTEGFLQLLASLFALGGCPSDLGQNWRARPGCAPYIEYVLDFILPRVTGECEKLPHLPFRSIEDKSRLSVLALQVVETVLARYLVPTAPFAPDESAEKLTARLLKSTRAAATGALGHVDLARLTTLLPNSDDVMLFQDDFRKTIEAPAATLAPAGTAGMQTSVGSSMLPPTKAPGFAILAEMLCPDGCNLFNAVVSTLVDRGSESSAAITTNIHSMAYALYVSTPPTLSSAKEGVVRSIPVNEQQTLLMPLRQPLEREVDSAGITWAKQAVLVALRILCATLAREEVFKQSISAIRGRVSVVPVLRFQKKAHIPTVIEMQVTRLSHMLVGADTHAGILGSIIEKMGFASMDDAIDIDISSAATAIVICVEQSLPPDQARALLCHMRVDLAVSIRKMLLVASTRPLARSDAARLRLIFDRLLFELRSHATSTFVTAIFGLETSQNGGPRDCLEALEHLLGKVDFVFGNHDSDLASSGYEIMYRLTKIENGQLALLSAARLRAMEFWKTHLLKICTALVNRSSTTTSHAVHAIAWLVKGAATELYTLAGFSGDAPRPGQYKSLCHALFSETGVIVRIIRILPIERPSVHQSHAVHEQAVIGAKVALRGSPEVVQGYSTISECKLVDSMKSHGAPVEEDAVLAWAEQWNRFVVMDCASAHLSDAVYVAVGSLSSSSKGTALSVDTEGIVAGHKLLVCIMEQMTFQGDPATSAQELDAVFFTTASRNLALAAHMIATFISSQGGFAKSRVDTSHACDLMVQAIAHSVGVGQVGLDADRKNERVSVLASTLVLILSDLPDQVNSEGEQSDMFVAAGVLSHLAGTVPLPQILSVPTCLTLLLKILESSTTTEKEVSPSRSVLTDTSRSSVTPIRAMIDLIPLLDVNVASMLYHLSVFPQVTDIMLESGVLEALEKAAEKYRDEEGKYLEHLRANSVLYGEPKIGMPPFLLGHFELMGALLVSQVSVELRDDMAARIMTIFRSYSSVFERAIGTFPLDGDVLLAMLRCLAQAHTQLGNAVNGHTTISRQGLGAEDRLGTPQLLGKVVSLSMHIAENLLPDRLLNKVPFRIAFSREQAVSSIVVSSSPNKNSWWDTLLDTKQAGSTELTEDVCRLGNLGTDLLRYGLLVTRNTKAAASLDEFALARALVRSVNAAVLIEAALRSSPQQQQYSYDGSHDETYQQLATYGSKLNAVVGELVERTLARVRLLKSSGDFDGPTVSSFCGTISCALNHCQFENLGASRLGSNENHPGTTAALSALREELELK